MFDCFVAGVWPPTLYPPCKGALYDCDSTAEEAASKKKDYICKGRTTTLLRGPSLSLMHVLTAEPRPFLATLNLDRKSDFFQCSKPKKCLSTNIVARRFLVSIFFFPM